MKVMWTGVGLPTDYPLALTEHHPVQDARLTPVRARYLLPTSVGVTP